MARIFLAGASGIIGQRLIPLLVRAGHQVTGTTRTAGRTGMLRTLGATPVVVDVLEASLLAQVMAEHAPEVVIHQLTSLPDHMASLDAAGLERAIRANARIRSEGTPALVAAATACRARRLVAQSLLWIYAPGREPHVESDPIDVGSTGRAADHGPGCDGARAVRPRRTDGPGGAALRVALRTRQRPRRTVEGPLPPRRRGRPRGVPGGRERRRGLQRRGVEPVCLEREGAPRARFDAGFRA